MSIFNRIAAIENRMSSLESRLSGGSGSQDYSKKNKSDQPQGPASFQNILSSLSDQKFVPDAHAPAPVNAPSAPTNEAQKLNSASVQPYVAEAAAKYDVDPALIEAVIKQESAYDAGAQSGVGAQGLMQLMPATAADLGVENSMDPRQNVMGGAKYLSQLLGQYDGNMTMTLAAYNAGPGNVAHYGGVPPFEETQNYVQKVLKNYGEFKA